MLVLEGAQGRQKSTALRCLCPDETWFTDYMPNHASKDAAMQCKGAWIIEDAELKATKASRREASKSFQTRRVDKFRLPYGRYTIQSPRHCVIAGTVNPPSDGRYLKDTTGNRRYWPVAVADNIDTDRLVQDRDQLWAEAVKCYRDKMPWHLETPELEALAEAEQAKRVAINDLHGEMIDWLNSLAVEGTLPNQSDVSVTECLNGIFPDGREHRKSDVDKVAAILKSLGFKRYRPNQKGMPRTPRYRKS
jgi:predicted P-loop ATPase